MSEDIVLMEVVVEQVGDEGPFFVGIPQLLVRGEAFAVPTIGKYVVEFEQDSVATITVTMPLSLRVERRT